MPACKGRRRFRLFPLLLVFLLGLSAPRVLASIWISAPKPKFPAAALSRGKEGYVVVRAFIAPDGSVRRAAVSKSSGDASLDQAAWTAILKWKMSPAVIKRAYLTKGYEQRIDFRQETPVAARYRDRRAYFGSFASARIWTYAPFPEYPFHERLVRTEGTAYVRLDIGSDGGVVSVALARSSGNANLDRAALTAVRSWRAHKEYAGRCFVIPIRFVMGR